MASTNLSVDVDLDEAKIEKLKLKTKEQEVEIEKLKLEKREQQVETARLRKELLDKDEALEHSQEPNDVLMLKEHEHNDELQQIRKLLIRVSSFACPQFVSTFGPTLPSQRGAVRLRLMGELDRKPFLQVVKDKCNFLEEQASRHSDNICSFWEGLLKDLTWYPFKITLVDGKPQEFVDHEDAFLKSLKNEWGEKVYDAVVNALVELNEYNSNGRTPVQELWNFEENRGATLMEGASSVLNRRRKRPTTAMAATSTPKRPATTATAMSRKGNGLISLFSVR
ncbi:hypothetical protein C5167_031569, partial [Papaver somniferum]